ncbi:cytochrome b5-like isoform X2 [Palaemon carinicauda]|uniref:cytochrome b5-like isoform X2 n=1 Tax=Palaemon carinicauda TaxID=392227 RepID=UPI0035B61E57
MANPENEVAAKEENKASARVFTLAEVAEHKSSDSCYMVIHDRVYDVTKFLDEHPGGEEVLLEQAGSNTTEAFEDVGHSTDARTMMADYYIGELCEANKQHTKDKGPKKWTSSDSTKENSWKSWLIPVGIACLASLIYRLYKPQ